MYGRYCLLRHTVRNYTRLAVLGCGEGDNVFDVQDTSQNIHCFDINLHDVRVAKISLNSSVCVSQQDIEHLAYTSSSFDGIICLETLEHVPDIHKAIAEIARITTKNAHVILSVPNYHFSFFNDPINYILQNLFQTHLPLGVYGFGHKKLYTEEEMKSLLASNFTVKRVFVINKACVGIIENYIPFFIQLIWKENKSNTYNKSFQVIATQKKYTIPLIFAFFYSFLYSVDVFICAWSHHGQTLFFECQRR
jgi:ubiquinone/menaquinone biosynthesis C-methylase UbiE